MGKSLTFRGAVYEASELLKTHRCNDPICETHLWNVRSDLDHANARIKRLEEELINRGITPLTMDHSTMGKMDRNKRSEKV